MFAENVTKRILLFQNEIHQNFSCILLRIQRDNSCSHFLHHEKVEEIEIDVPWGKIAGKWWGPKDVRPIVAMHGWQDNAGSFDALIPLLPKHVSYLALDLPGHGHSSRIPHGLYYSTAHVLHCLNIIREQYQWDQLSFLTHSMSCIIAFLYAGLFPERCDLLIQLDALKPFHATPSRVIKHFIKLGDEFTLADKRNQEKAEPPSYTYEQIVDRWVTATKSSITKEAATHLMKRALKTSSSDPNKYYFSRDARLKYFNFAYIPQDLSCTLAKLITAPHLCLKASKSPYFEEKQNFDEAVEVLRESNPKFMCKVLEGTHHFHMTSPEVVAPDVSEFILKYRPTEN